MISTVLTQEQIGRIDEASLEVLQHVGVGIPHEQMLGMFADMGADVDRENQRVKIPPDLVRTLLGGAGKQFTLYGRDLSKTAPFGYGTRNYQPSSGQALWIDELGGERRYPCMADVINTARCADAIDSLNMTAPMADPHEIPVAWRNVAVMAELIKNSTKPLSHWFYDRASSRYLVELVIALRGDEAAASKYPLCYPLLEPISPLRFPFDGIDLLFEISRIDIPVILGPMSQMGLSAPGTMAGTMVQENAEVLAGICIIQLVKQGLPVCYGGICHAFDMATTQIIFGGPEQAIFSVAMAQMGRHYGFPVYINTSLVDSKCADAQAGLEAGVTMALGAAAGGDLLGQMGICGADQGASLDMLLMHSEIIAYVESTMREIDFSDDALGIDQIKANALKGTYIDTMHTADHFRKELWFPRLLDRNYYDAWRESGALSMQERCRLRKEEILRDHKPEPVSQDLEAALDEIVAAAKKDLGS